MKVIFKANNENFEIDLTYEQIEFLKNFSVKRFRAKKNKNYYYIDSDLSIKSSLDKTQKEDLNRFKIGNYFESEKEAAYSIEKILLNQSYLDYIKSKSSVVDWYNQNQKKYYAYYNFNKNEILIGETKVTKRQGVIYSTSKDIIIEFIKKITIDKFKKYILDVIEEIKVINNDG